MNGSSWAARAAARIDTWPVGPIAGLMLGGATAFFCWAMQLVLGGAAATAIVPGVLVGVLTWMIFRFLDARAVAGQALFDEGDDQEDWLTRPSRHRPEAAMAPRVRPLTIDIIADYAPPLAVMPLAGVDPTDERAELLLDEIADRPAESVPAASIAVLMDRLAVGMAAMPPTRDEVSASAESLASCDRAADDELRLALAGLHRMAARHG